MAKVLQLALGLCLAVAFGCAGAQAAPLCGGASYRLTGGRGGVPPKLTLTLDGVTGLFLVDYGATRSSLSVTAFGGVDGSARKARLPLPGVSEQAFLLRSYDPKSPWIGILGADVLSRLVVEFSEGVAFLGPQSCGAEGLSAAGLVPIAEKGFFSADPDDVDPAQPNVPVVFLSLGQVHVFAQIDTGYADTVYPDSVDINEPLYERLAASGVGLARVGTIGVRTCEGVIESRPVYSTKGAALGVENDLGQPVARTDHFFLVVKAANACGGIGSMRKPAAQLGASFLDVFGTAVFDPKAERVWLRAQGDGTLRN
jgi:hypothetical protein